MATLALLVLLLVVGVWALLLELLVLVPVV
jgi:hypothetical protein